MNSESTSMDAEPSQLAELLACERELAELLARAQEEARRIVEAARDEATHAAADLEATLDAESEQLRAEIHANAQAALRDIAARSRARVARFEGVSDEAVARLADLAFRRLIGTEGAP